VLAGDAQTGVTIMQMDEGLDTGAMLLAESLPIGPNDTTADLHDRLAALGANLILKALQADCIPVPQPETGATYAPKLSKADAVIDWSEPAEAILRRIRAFQPWPGYGDPPGRRDAQDHVGARGSGTWRTGNGA
ncbi:unnamed protein product, partial [Acidocella sp. C78]